MKHMPNINMQPRGFIALTSVIIIAAILLVMAAAGSLSGFFTRSDGLDVEYKTHSHALADACVDEVLLKLGSDATYSGGDTVAVGSDSCTILAGASGTPRVFEIQAIYNHAYTNLEVAIDPSTLLVRSAAEVPTF